jgi:hypothetical protein
MRRKKKFKIAERKAKTTPAGKKNLHDNQKMAEVWKKIEPQTLGESKNTDTYRTQDHKRAVTIAKQQ